MKKYDLTWGESVCVREAFVNSLSGLPLLVTGKSELMGYGYPKHEGDPKLIGITKKVIKRQTGLDYNYVFLTNGAVGAITIMLRAYNTLGYNTVFTLAAPYFALYPSMIKTAGMLNHRKEADLIDANDIPVFLLDSPSNPKGYILSGDRVSSRPIIWDAVYNNQVYAPLALPIKHDVMVGSYSKLTGVNGLRVGWIATNDPALYALLDRLVTAEYCGLSSASTAILTHYLDDNFDWAKFEKKARLKLNRNREEFAKLEKYLGGYSVTPVGMFHYAPMDEACKKLMEKAGIQWMPGSSLGATDDFGRFNLGQDNELITLAVKSVLKADKI